MGQHDSSEQAYLMFTPNIVSQDACDALINKVQQVYDEGGRRITLLISSPGGNVYAGLLAYNFLKGCPIDLTTHNVNTCDSIAGVIFAAGDTRLSVPHGRFLLHSTHWTFQANTTFNEIQLGETLKEVRTNTENVAGVIAAATGKDESEIYDDMRRSLTLNPEEAVEYRLVHRIQEHLYPDGVAVTRVA